MKIVLAHNFYGSEAPSGENIAVKAEQEMLEKNGHEVILFSRSSDKIRKQGWFGAIRGGFAAAWNPWSLYRLRRLIKREQPDILHVHNVFPMLSPAILFAAKNTPTATVVTAHNYRMFCASGVLARNGNICTDCLDARSVLPAIKRGCYRGSRVATIPMGIMISLHRRLRTWHEQVDAFISLTLFQRNMLIRAGIDGSKIHVKGHFMDKQITFVPWNSRKDRALFIGRLSSEKGVKHLIEAWRLWGESASRLDIIGDGPDKESLLKLVIDSGLEDKIRILGQLDFPEVQKRLSESKLLLLPSLCFEGFPMVIREAFSLGVPVAGSDIGSIACLIDNAYNGLLFKPGCGKDIYQTIYPVWGSEVKFEMMAKNALSTFETYWVTEKNYKCLMDIYGMAIERKMSIQEKKNSLGFRI